MNGETPAGFHARYAAHYRALPRHVYWLIPVLLGSFVAVLALLAFVRIDKVIDVPGEIVSRTVYETRLPQRGFVVEHQLRAGQWLRRGQFMASVRQDDGSLRIFVAPHDGLVLETGLRHPRDGALAEGFLLATLVDPADLVIRVDLPPAVRGSIQVGSPAYYRFDTFIAPTRTHVVHYDVGLAPNTRVTSSVDLALDARHRMLSALSKQLPVRLVQHDLALIDYFLLD